MSVQDEGTFSDDYHDYVIRDGRLIGDFENMYRYAKTIPWEQDIRCEQWSCEVGTLMIKERAPYNAVLEIGCGLGYVATKLKGFSASTVDAFDVSTEAIRRAKASHQGIEFFVADVTDPNFVLRKSYDLVVVRDLFWYVSTKLVTVVHNITAAVKPGGYVSIRQSFPALNSPFVGKEDIPNPEALVAIFNDFAPIFSAVLRNHENYQDGPVLHFFGRRKG